MLRVICGALLMAVISNGAALAESLGIYTHRQPFLLEPILEPTQKDRRGIPNCLRAKRTCCSSQS